jgi:hypothetical protein
MGVAVCGTHYCGMGAASYAPTEENYTQPLGLSVDAATASVVASHSAILLCYWFTSLCVIKSVRVTEAKSKTRAEDRSSHAPNLGTVPKSGSVKVTMTSQPPRATVYSADHPAN